MAGRGGGAAACGAGRSGHGRVLFDEVEQIHSLVTEQVPALSLSCCRLRDVGR